MNITETQEMRKRLENVINAAAEYGKQAEQFASAKGNLTEYLSHVQETNEKLLSLISQMSNLLEDTGKLVNGALTDELQPEIDKAHNLIKSCEDQLSNVTLHYQTALEKLEGSKDVLAEQHHQAEMLLTQTVEKVKESLQDARSAIAKMESGNADLQKNLGETIKDTFCRIEGAIAGMPETMKELSASVTSSSAEQVKIVSGLKNSMQEVSLQMAQLSIVPQLNQQILQSMEKGNGTLQSAINSTEQAVSASVATETSRLKEELGNIRVKQQAIEVKLSRIKDEQETAKKELNDLVQEAINQVNTSAKRQRIMTIGCSVAVIIAVGILLILK